MKHNKWLFSFEQVTYKLSSSANKRILAFDAKQLGESFMAIKKRRHEERCSEEHNFELELIREFVAHFCSKVSSSRKLQPTIILLQRSYRSNFFG